MISKSHRRKLVLIVSVGRQMRGSNKLNNLTVSMKITDNETKRLDVLFYFYTNGI